ncbi:putative bifunctional diguanylate cyclase/phosphodiesterase [Aquicella lusitana]|uniref:Diguanylate cyclase (GGDEF)-like protein n=1 Tax=Aquicella lusitana TaxID=254246 RepID=A0A370GDQ8_9COXI|nr:EAL domain-containing protein [Aquicella lusitana]RDI41821.1 diguanylate cyclase (GGDEF)-like protein [Aquicella lusitana]VVC73729.1 Phytochrome-like protein cph2 [Aquicella lusitana]
MELSYLIAGISFIVLCLAFVFCKRSGRQAGLFKNELRIAEAKAKKSQENEIRLIEEISLLQNKLRFTLEDPVTGLSGWKLFEDRLNQNIKESERYQLTLGVMFVDINDFRMINDALGYEVGDALLRETAERLVACIRRVDSISRFTKDTFVILLTQLSKPETAAVVAQRILKSLAEPFQIRGQELYVTACIGISIYPVDGQDAETLLRGADYALHLAKEKGKHLYQFYQEKIYAKSQRELVLSTGLNKDSLFQEFALYYQPVVNITNESVFCMDTLLHWQHPELGLIGPDELFNYAEKNQKLNAISEWLFENACRQFLHWRSLGFYPEHIGIPVRLNQLESSQFIYRLSQLIQDLACNPEWILLEIQEGTNQLQFDVLEKAFNMLKFVGVKLAVQNFGKGTFSLQHLKDFPIHYLKLDPALIKDIDTNLQTQALAKSLIYLSTNMDMQVIIQGVESNQQMELLKKLGYSLMQGQLLGGPLSEHEVTDKMVV